MVSLWGSKNGEEQGDGDGRASTDGDDGRQPPRHGDAGGRNPDERTRLLPPRNDGFLDPDDPAVSTCSLCSALLLLINLFAGFALQSMDRPSLALHFRPLPDNQLPLVGAVACFHIHQPTNDALTRLRLLRLLLHYPHGRKPAHCHTVFHCAFQTYGDPYSGCVSLLTD